jgi:hypothetical protein
MVPTRSLFYNLFSFLLDAREDLIKFTPQDCGFEVAEDEIVSGMFVQVPDCLRYPSIPEVEPEEFEEVYGYFLS